MIADALAASKNKSLPPVGTADKNELDRLVTFWLAKCGRPTVLVEDAELHTVLARILELCQVRTSARPHRTLASAQLASVLSALCPLASDASQKA